MTVMHKKYKYKNKFRQKNRIENVLKWMIKQTPKERMEKNCAHQCLIDFNVSVLILSSISSDIFGSSVIVSSLTLIFLIFFIYSSSIWLFF